MGNLVKIETLQPGLVLVTLNRPERRNALCIELLEELCLQVEAMASAKSARVMILNGAGPIFCSGLDLSEASQPELVHRSATILAKALQLMRSTGLITIAAAQGGAYAGGAGLMAACDFAIGASDLKIGFPEARRGLLPALICAVMSPKVREGDLRELFLVGNNIDANRALQIGLLQRVAPLEKLLQNAIEMAESVLAGGPETIKATKMLLNHAYAPQEAICIPDMLEMHLTARNSSEATEGLAAFLQKRPPKWMASET
ncbi:MAG: enoyl-CoA hydratase-related protein [Pirellulaceae bacterium]|nr:enoyl-CoA hydratase-related protein [Pirellulaceae bacterium]